MKNNLGQFELINSLLDLYGFTLTSRQLEIMESYYKYNLSLSEISENLKISRAACQEAIKLSSAKLIDYEEELKMNKGLKKLDVLAKKLEEKNDKENELLAKEVIDLWRSNR